MKNPKLNNQSNETAIEIQIKKALATDGQVLAAIRTAFPQTLAVYAFGSRINATANAAVTWIYRCWWPVMPIRCDCGSCPVNWQT